MLSSTNALSELTNLREAKRSQNIYLYANNIAGPRYLKYSKLFLLERVTP